MTANGLVAVAASVVALAGRSVRRADLERWHRTLFDGCVPVPYYAGNFRQVNNRHKPCLDARVGVNRGPFKHPPAVECATPETVIARMSALEQKFADLDPQPKGNPTPSALAFSAALANCVGEFIRIHPFVNGNGRVSRTLWAWGMARFSYAPQVSISPRPDPPYAEVMDAALLGDDLPLARFILDRLHAAGQAAAGQAAAGQAAAGQAAAGQAAAGQAAEGGNPASK